MAFPFAIVGFDLDGTLLDSAADLAAAANHGLSVLGRPTLSVAAVKGMTGLGTARMFTRALEATGGFDPAAFERGYAELLAYYEAHIAVHTRPFPGVIAALDDLRARGARLAVVTNKLEHLATALLEALDIADRFDTVIGGDTMGEGKPSPAPLHEMIRRLGGGSAAFVGDSIHDVRAAHAAGMPVVQVNLSPTAEPEPLGADALIESFDALIPALERLAGNP